MANKTAAVVNRDGASTQRWRVGHRRIEMQLAVHPMTSSGISTLDFYLMRAKAPHRSCFMIVQ